jgi:hypothetical protein
MEAGRAGFPIVGYLDYRWDQHGILVDLKTTEKLPSSIKIPHARQVALYATMTGDNVDARLTYVHAKEARDLPAREHARI